MFVNVKVTIFINLKVEDFHTLRIRPLICCVFTLLINDLCFKVLKTMFSWIFSLYSFYLNTGVGPLISMCIIFGIFILIPMNYYQVIFLQMFFFVTFIVNFNIMSCGRILTNCTVIWQLRVTAIGLGGGIVRSVIDVMQVHYHVTWLQCCWVGLKF